MFVQIIVQIKINEDKLNRFASILRFLTYCIVAKPDHLQMLKNFSLYMILICKYCKFRGELLFFRMEVSNRNIKSKQFSGVRVGVGMFVVKPYS